MKVFVQSINFSADRDLVIFAEDKVTGLEKFYDKIVSAEVFMKTEHTSEKENKIAEIKVNIPGGELIVKKQCKSFEEGIQLSIDSLRRQLEKKKEKLRTA